MKRTRLDGSTECDEGDQAADPESGGERVERIDAEVDRTRRGCVPSRGNGHRGSDDPAGRSQPPSGVRILGSRQTSTPRAT